MIFCFHFECHNEHLGNPNFVSCFKKKYIFQEFFSSVFLTFDVKVKENIVIRSNQRTFFPATGYNPETLTFLKDIFSDNVHFKNNSIQLNIKFIHIAGFIWLQLQLELWTDRRFYSVLLLSLFFFFYHGKINSIRFAMLSVQFSSIKYIHIFLQPSALSNFRTFSSSPVKTLFPLNKHSISSPPPC